MEKKNAIWIGAKGDVLLGTIEEIGERFLTISLISAEMKRKNAKPIPKGTKFLVPSSLILHII